MEMSRKDMFVNVVMWASGMIIILLIAYDPLDILNTTQKVIIVVIMTILLLPLLLYRRQRLLKKMKNQPSKIVLKE
jgi:Mn2+/Fe2+ NRAMP family transporter